MLHVASKVPCYTGLKCKLPLLGKVLIWLFWVAISLIASRGNIYNKVLIFCCGANILAVDEYGAYLANIPEFKSRFIYTGAYINPTPRAIKQRQA